MPCRLCWTSSGRCRAATKQYSRNVRRGVVRGYPYCIYYREEPTQVRVLSVFHTSRDPTIWQSRA